jgi:hypothetical protein
MKLRLVYLSGKVVVRCRGRSIGGTAGGVEEGRREEDGGVEGGVEGGEKEDVGVVG